MAKDIIQFLLTVGVSALIGWITNVLAIKMLFRPHDEVNVLGLKFQGLIPRRRLEIAEKIAKTIDEELISLRDITQKIENINVESEVEEMVNKIVDTKLKEEITNRIPMAGLFMSNSLFDKLKVYLKTLITDNRHEITGVIISKMEDEIDFKKIVREKIENFSLMQLENIIISIAKAELKEIEVLGGVLGGIIGIVQFFIVKVIA